MDVRCPVCAQSAEYPERYAGKWHRCRAGCVALGTRLLLCGPVALSEEQVRERWTATRRRGRRQRALAALACLPLLTLPLLSGGRGAAWLLALAAAGLGAVATAAGLRAAWRYAPARPPGL